MSGHENFESESSGLMLVGIQGGHFFIHSFEKTGETNEAIIFCCKKILLGETKNFKNQGKTKKLKEGHGAKKRNYRDDFLLIVT